MLIVALVLAMIGLAALVTAVVTSNELIAWVCIGASALGILLLIVDAIRDRAHRRQLPPAVPAAPVETTEVIEPVETTEVIEPVDTTETADLETSDLEPSDLETSDSAGDFTDETAPESDLAGEEIAEEIEIAAEEDHPDELVYEDPDYDLPSDDEADYPEPAEEAAIHTVDESSIAQDVDDEDVPVIEDESATEVRYVASPEGSAPTVVYTYSEHAETEHAETEYAETEYAETEYAETEYADTEDSPVGEDRPDR
jgi:hypothetical protein